MSVHSNYDASNKFIDSLLSAGLASTEKEQAEATLKVIAILKNQPEVVEKAFKDLEAQIKEGVVSTSLTERIVKLHSVLKNTANSDCAFDDPKNVVADAYKKIHSFAKGYLKSQADKRPAYSCFDQSHTRGSDIHLKPTEHARIYEFTKEMLFEYMDKLPQDVHLTNSSAAQKETAAAPSTNQKETAAAPSNTAVSNVIRYAEDIKADDLAQLLDDLPDIQRTEAKAWMAEHKVTIKSINTADGSITFSDDYTVSKDGFMELP